jgi:type I restriction enzyme, S subunit
MTEWRETTLADLCTDISYGYTESAKQEKVGPKFLRITDIASGRLEWTNVPYCPINEDDFEKYKLLPGDIVIARTGATTGANYTIKKSDPKDVVFASYLIRYKIDKEIADPYFIGHLLRSPNWSDYVDAIAGGSAQPGANAKQLGSFEILLPPFETQKAIASVLSGLDDKIDLLHRQNKTLEQMAEALFRQWFVVEASEEWEVGKLGDEFDFTMGASPPGKSYNENGMGIPMYQGNADFGFRFPKNRVFTTEPKRFAEKYDTLISVRAPVGEQNMAIERCCIGRGVSAFRYEHDNSFYTYTYYKMKSLMDDIKQFNETGTVFGSISKSDFENIEIYIPDKQTVSRFQYEAKPIDDKVILNTKQIHTLEKLRDTLLPKLMRGEVKIEMN